MSKTTLMNNISRAQKELADITVKLHKNQVALQKEEERERNKLAAERSRQNEQMKIPHHAWGNVLPDFILNSVRGRRHLPRWVTIYL